MEISTTMFKIVLFLQLVPIIFAIWNGKPLEVEEAPYQVYLNALTISGWNDCSGVIISNRHVLTAAHCVIYDDDAADNKPVIHAFITAGSKFTHRGSGVVVGVKTIIVDQNYSNDPFLFSSQNDLAILELEWDLEFSTTIQRIQLPENGSTIDNIEEGTFYFFCGWGLRSNGKPSSVLRGAFLPYIGLHENRIYTLEGDHGEWPDFGDSGGPLVDKKNGVLIGILSAGTEEFAPKISVFVDIANKREFINEHVNF